MKFFILFFLIIASCSSPITEVGNPKEKPKSALALAQFFLEIPQDLQERSAESTLIKAIMKKATSDEEACITSEPIDGVLISTCTCPEGGSYTETTLYIFEDVSDTIFQYSDTFTMNFDNCGLTSCLDETLFVSGDLHGTTSIVYNTSDDTYTGDFSFVTNEACRGLTANSIPVGLSIQGIQESSMSEPNLSGSYCENETTLTFSSNEDLVDQVDTEGVCTSTF